MWRRVNLAYLETRKGCPVGLGGRKSRRPPWDGSFGTIMFLLLRIKLLVLLGFVFLLPSGCFAAEDDSSLAGIYRDEKIVVELTAPSPSGSTSTYRGTIQVGQQKLPLEAQATEGKLKGTFTSQGDRFEFEGSIVGQTFVLTTEGTTYRLRKQSNNPLAKPSRPNPLAAAKTNPIAPAAVQVPVKESIEAPISSIPSLRFQHYGVRDNPDMIGGEAFDLLIPVEWQVEGGVFWRIYLAAPACVVMRVKSPNRLSSWEVFPTIPFVWADGGIPGYPIGTNYLGNEVREPVADPQTYVRLILLPRFRREVPQPAIVQVEDLPDLAEAIGENAQEAGVEKKIRAARVRIEYPESGRTMQEDVYCVLTSAYAPAIKTTLWGPERNYSFKAEKGKLDAETPVFQTMVQSFKPNLPWFNRYFQLVQLLLKEQPEALRHPIGLPPYIARTSTEITETSRQAYVRQETSRMRINDAYLKAVRGLFPYRNPFDGQVVQLPSGYLGNWANPSGMYLLSNDSGLNPSAQSSITWQRLTRAP